MCNRHIMANLFRMNADGSNITQIGVSTLFEGHSAMLQDGRIMYDRWEYVDRNFGDAQGLWTVNPDGTKHAIYYGNNTKSPGGVIDARAIPGSDLITCIFGSCHDRPWGALVVLDRKKGVDGPDPVLKIFPKESKKLMNTGNLDSFKGIARFYEDPYALNETQILVSRTSMVKRSRRNVLDSRQALYLVNTETEEEDLILGLDETNPRSLFDPIIIAPHKKPNVIPSTNRNFEDKNGIFYVQNVYEGTNMKGVEKGSAKYLRLIETPEKRTYTVDSWAGEGAQAPGINWHSFETKKIWGEFPIEEDGSVHFEAPAGKHLFFQLLDKDKKMIQSMRSGVSLMPGETYGCVGCHENRLSVPAPHGKMPKALTQKPQKINGWMGKEAENFSFLKTVQPVFDRNCVKCHDFDIKDRNKLVLAGDKNMFFNAAYINIYVKGLVSLVGGGPAAIKEAYSWGTHKSKLTQIIDGNHKKVKMSEEDKQILYTWMDLNGGYYPTYDSAFWDTLAGRSPLTAAQNKRLTQLTGVNFAKIASHKRKVQAQISFERPELSPALDAIREGGEKANKAQYNEAIEIIKKGNKVLEKTPRGDIEETLVPCAKHKEQLARYVERMEGKNNNTWFNNPDKKKYDK